MERSDYEQYLKKLQELDQNINDDANPDEFMEAVNQILNGLSQDVQTDITEKSRPVLKFINTSKNPDPSFSSDGASGFDIRANLDKDLHINEHCVAMVPTGLYVEVNKGLEVQIRSRSGLAAGPHLFVLNSPGTVDSDYRGEIKIILANFSDNPSVIRNGDRIAQGVVCPVYGSGSLNMIKVEKLSETQRNSGGFGSTGVS